MRRVSYSVPKHLTRDFLQSLQTPGFWLSVVVVGLAANWVASMIQAMFFSFLKRGSHTLKNRSAVTKAAAAKRIDWLSLSIDRRSEAGANALALLLGSVAAMVLTLAIYQVALLKLTPSVSVAEGVAIGIAMFFASVLTVLGCWAIVRASRTFEEARQARRLAEANRKVRALQ